MKISHQLRVVKNLVLLPQAKSQHLANSQPQVKSQPQARRARPPLKTLRVMTPQVSPQSTVHQVKNSQVKKHLAKKLRVKTHR